MFKGGRGRVAGLAGAIFLAIGPVEVSGAGSPLDERVEAVLTAPDFGASHWGLLVVDVASGRVVYEREADRLFCPASVTKLFTTAAALAELGAEHRFKTPVVRRGEVKDGVLRGDLILVARGDLSLGGRTGPDGSLLFEDNDHSYAAGQPRRLARPGRAPGRPDPPGPRGPRRRDPLDHRRRPRRRPLCSTRPRAPGAARPGSRRSWSTTTWSTSWSRPGRRPATRRRSGWSPRPRSSRPTSLVETSAEGPGPASVQVRAVGPRRFAVRGQVPLGHRAVVKTYEVEEPAAFARALFIETLRARGVRRSPPRPWATNPRGPLPSRAEVADPADGGRNTPRRRSASTSR